VDNVAKVITIVCGASTTEITYQNAFVGGSAINVTVAINATADINTCYSFNACFDTYNVNTLLWDPYTRSLSTTESQNSSHHSTAAFTNNVSFFVIMIAAIAFFFEILNV